MIGLFLGWGAVFHILLDSDEEGTHQRARYLQKFGSVLNERIIALDELLPRFAGKSLEALFEEEDKTRLVESVFPDTAVNKKTLWRSVEHLVATGGSSPPLTEAGKSLLHEFHEALGNRLSATATTGAADTDPDG